MKTNAFVHYSVIHGFFWMAYCAATGFSSTYLLYAGFENGQIGVMVAISGLLAAFLQPALADRIDNSGKRLLKTVLYGCIGIAVFLSALILAIPEENRMTLGVCFCGNLMLLQIMIPLINALSICGHDHEKINFGFSRAVGSLTYAGISYALGIIIAARGMQMLSWMRIVSFVGVFCALLIFPVDNQERQDGGKEKKKHRQKESGQGFFGRNPGFMVMLAGCFMIYLCHSFLTYYNYQIVLSKGGDAQTFGVVIALAAMVELPAMFGFSFMLRKAPASFWFGMSGIGYVLKATGCLLVTNMTGYYCIQIFQMLSWAVISVASVSFVKEVIPKEDATRGQAFLTLSYTLAMAGGSLSGGFLLQLVDVRAMLCCAIAFSLIGTAILCLGIRRILRRL